MRSSVMLIAMLSACGPGPMGPEGPPGPAGESGLRVVESQFCESSQGRFGFTYQWSQFSSGDVWVGCEVVDYVVGAGFNSSYFRVAGNNQASYKICAVHYDTNEVKSDGTWGFTYDGLVNNVHYADPDGVNPLHNFDYAFASGECL